jgi:hypothetical protein
VTPELTVDARRTELFVGVAWRSDWVTVHCGQGGQGLRVSAGASGVLNEHAAERVRTALEALRALRRELEEGQ